MKQEDMKNVEQAIDGFYVGYAYLYPNDGGARQEYVFDMTPENIANFLGSHQFDVEKIVLTDMLDRLILDTAGGFINNCPDQERCKSIVSLLASIQMGEKEATEFPMVTRELYEQYIDMEEQAVMEAEIRML